MFTNGYLLHNPLSTLLCSRGNIIISTRMSQQSHKNTCLIVIGMSGTGKTTFVNKISTRAHLYTINLDPAVKSIPYEPIVDIRKTHEYKKIMKDYQLGPNGAILTALNLFLSQPETIVDTIKAITLKYPQHNNTFVIDIPGQIEVFTWSSSSLILTEAIATLMPVKIAYIIDSVRCNNPNVFLSNILFAQSIQYRFNKYPFTILLNKSDFGDTKKLKTWVDDYQAFMGALHEDPSYLATLSKSVVLHLSDFYSQLKFMSISAKTGAGIEQALGSIVQ